ncbi:hypothetical protein WSM22_03500 [Cytophagales bacterium WSM2-2]|nr:hypothetical protein WSM22_03500 [Cytophagales bacterium WSM2-2]
MNNKPKHRVNGKFAKKEVNTRMTMEKVKVIQDQILEGLTDIELITEAFNYLHPDKKDELINFPYKRRAVFMFGKMN